MDRRHIRTAANPFRQLPITPCPVSIPPAPVPGTPLGPVQGNGCRRLSFVAIHQPKGACQAAARPHTTS
jgi:hypothetical protein